MTDKIVVWDPATKEVLERLSTTGIPPNPEWLKAVRLLATTDIPPATKKAYEALKRNNYENPGKEPPFWPNDY